MGEIASAVDHARPLDEELIRDIAGKRSRYRTGKHPADGTGNSTTLAASEAAVKSVVELYRLATEEDTPTGDADDMSD
jgi:hypothetical protein